MKKLIIIILIAIMIPIAIVAQDGWKEIDYQEYANANYFYGTENVYITGQYLTCDIVATVNGVLYAIEVDYVTKNSEAIGQSLIYSRYLPDIPIPGILIIKAKASNRTIERRINQLISTINAYNLPIKVWTIDENLIIEEIN